MKLSLVAFLCFYVTVIAFSSPQDKYSQVRIYANTPEEIQKISESGLDVHAAIHKPGAYTETWLSEYEIGLLRSTGVRFEVTVDDWDAYYSSLPVLTEAQRAESLRKSARESNVYHSIYGSMGGYMTYTEVVAKLDSMRLEYPDLISTKFSIGTTVEGRTMWAVRITKGPDAPTGRPEVLYHAVIHAREPESMETQMYYFYWLFENYGTDPLATYILNNREIYWVPIFNVDGYVYNQTTYPGGGGMWRCNRHNTGSNCGFVDLNRNYGIYQFWNSSNGGSSTDPCSGGQGTYRGPTPFSEIETQNMMNFVNSRNFNAIFGAHTYGNYLIKPWAWSDPSPTPDDAKFNRYLADMKASNPVYTTGTPSQTVGYTVRGGADDWYYNDSAHVGHHIFAITPETGDSFWPAQSEILPLAQGMLFNNQYMSMIGGAFVNPTTTAFNQTTYLPGQSGTFKAVFMNKGVLAASNVRVSWTSTNSAITIPTSYFDYPSMASFVADSAMFDFSISSLVSENSAIPVQFTIKTDTTTLYTARMFVLIGAGSIVLSDSANTFNNWTRSSGGTWAVTTAQSYSPPSSFTDSPGGNYPSNVDNSMILATPIDASAIPVLSVSYVHKYATESGYDYCKLEVSSNNGSSWQPVVSYDGTLSTWTAQSFNISNYANGSPLTKIRFRLTSDISVVADGWYVDNIVIRGYTIAQPPDTGVVVMPGSFNFSGLTGRMFRDSVTIYNYTAGPVPVSIAESTLVASDRSGKIPVAGQMDVASLLRRLRPAFERAHISRKSLQVATAASTTDNPEAYTTIITDERNENGLGAADVYRVLHQVRTTLGTTYDDFRVVTALPSDSNIVSFISIDTDQDFGTGAFPTPFATGSPMRDLGSEREILLDASGILIDSLTHIGRIPAGVVINSATDSLVGTPFLLAVTRDSVMTITTTNILGLGIRRDWLGDPDGNFNVGVASSRLSQGVSPMPDFAPAIAHGTVGTETGVSWISESMPTVTIPAGTSAVVRISALAARLPGTYNALLRFFPAGRAETDLPVHMTVIALAQPHIGVNATAFHDTLRVGDSTAHVITISNTGNADLVWGMIDTSNASWLSIAPGLGSVPFGGTGTSTATLRSGGLLVNTTYSATLNVLSNDQLTGTIAIPVTVRVTPSTGIANGPGMIPTSYALHQNYPNPFNPETHVSFNLPRSSQVSLKLYNVIGQEVATIVNETLPAGTYTYRVGGERMALTSGVYFYKLSAGDFLQTRKMILMK